MKKAAILGLTFLAAACHHNHAKTTTVSTTTTKQQKTYTAQANPTPMNGMQAQPPAGAQGTTSTGASANAPLAQDSTPIGAEPMPGEQPQAEAGGIYGTGTTTAPQAGAQPANPSEASPVAGHEGTEATPAPTPATPDVDHESTTTTTETHKTTTSTKSSSKKHKKVKPSEKKPVSGKEEDCCAKLNEKQKTSGKDSDTDTSKSADSDTSGSAADTKSADSNPPAADADADMLQKIHDKLSAEKGISDPNAITITKDGDHLVLHGTVKSAKEKSLAEKTVKKNAGKMKVKDELTVESK
jgi:osmotically-inducible protein OsmY